MADFKSLETFVWVVRLSSFRGAAAKLCTTQPAISQRISQLETEFGVQLLRRQSRNVIPTKEGRDLLSYAERLLRLRGEMQATLVSPKALTGTFRLGVSETIVHTWLSRFIEQFNAAYPALSLEIDVEISTVLRDRLVAQEIDLAFLNGPVSAPSIRNMDLCQFPLGFVASPALGLPTTQVPLSTLARYPIITFSRLTRPYMAVQELFAKLDEEPLRFYTSASLAPAVRMALDGLAIAAIPPAIVEKEIAERRLAVITSSATLPNLIFTASWTANAGDYLPEQVANIAIKCAKQNFKSRKKA